MTAADVAERAGVSRGLLRRIENGDLGCTLGSVFEAASVVGVRLFDADQTSLSGVLASNTAVMTLLPRAIRAPRTKPDDDF
jgi:transcriptional regulator with XRE-family HTH domain